MSRLVLTFRDRSTVHFTGEDGAVAALADRIRTAMGRSVDTVISHDLDGDPRDFLCSEVATFHVEDLPEAGS